MPAPSPLSIATSSLQRLVKEETSYHKELQQQKAAIAKLEKLEGQEEAEGEEGNREFQLKQEKKALSETEAIFPPLQDRIIAAKEKLEGILEAEGISISTPSPGEGEEAKKARNLLIQLT